MIKTAQDAYLAGRHAAMEKLAVSAQDMRHYEVANLDAGTTPLSTVGTGVGAALLGGGLAASTGPGGLRSRITRGVLGALPGAALGAYLEDQRQAAYDNLYALEDSALRERYMRNKAVNDSLGINPFREAGY